MTLTLYGYAKSRAVRNLWLLEELGAPYAHNEIGFQNGVTRTPAFLKINPAGHIPAIDDGGFAMGESLAINLYLAKKHGKLYPADLQSEAKTWQWSFWVMSELDRPIVQWFSHAVLLPVEQRSASLALAAREEMEWPLTVLDDALKGRQYLVDPNNFTVADLNVASVLYRLLFADVSGKANLDAWLKRCWERPAAKKARAMREP